jgi:DNA-binding CsgD family transcriptional regulator
MTNDIINIIKVFNFNLDFSQLKKTIGTLHLNRRCNFVIYDLIKNRFIYFSSEKNEVFEDLPNECLNKGYLYLKNIFHPLDFANLIKEIVTLINYAEYTKRKIIKTANGGQILRTKSKNGEWQTVRVKLIYLNRNQEQIFKVLLAFIEEVTINQGPKITTREKEIFQLLSSGFSAKIIADKLNISETTVITHRKNLIHKLHVKNSAELIKKGFQLNLIS